MSSRKSRRSFIGQGLATLTAARVAADPSEPSAAGSALRTRISRADLIYDRPVERSEEGMPLGNGRMGTLVWTTPNQLRMQINRVDVYANNSYSNSFFERNNDYCGGCAYVDIDFGSAEQGPFEGHTFQQKLSVYDGIVTVDGKEISAQLVAWPEHDVIAIQVQTRASQAVSIKLRMLRHLSQYFGAELEGFARNHIEAVQTRSHIAKSQLLIEGDRIILTQEFRDDQYCNKSAVAIAMDERTTKPEIVSETEIRLLAPVAGKPITILIASASSFDTAADVVAESLRQLDSASAKSFSDLKSGTSDWWHDFWSRGSLDLRSPDGTAEFIEKNYHYFLYLMAASSRGKLPPKFNGMIWNTGGDLRTWGAQHWFANTSCYYEALFAANRPELLNPFFDMYSGMYDACATAARQQWGSEGIFIPETVYFDGLEKLPDDIAQEMRELYLMRKPWSERSVRFRTYSATKNPHSSRWNWMKSGQWVAGRWVIAERGSGPFGNVTHNFGTTAKIAYLYWRKFEYTQDKEWLRVRAYPMLRGAVEFYRHHPNVGKEDDGKYHIRYTNSNESVWGARDTDEDLSAMRGVLAALLRAADILNMDEAMRPTWREFFDNLTALPLSSDRDALHAADYRGPRVFARGRQPAIKADAGVLPDANSLPQWFFDLCNAGLPDSETLQIANTTFDAYFKKPIDAQTSVSVLSKLPIAAATLGRADAVRHLIANQIRAIRPERNTAYQNEGVLPNRMTLREGPQALDAERLGRAAEALHLALLQSAPPFPGADFVIRLFPAWPKEWSAHFQLLARGAFMVDAACDKGAVHHTAIHSLAGAECRLLNPWPEAAVTLVRNGTRAEVLTEPVLKFPTTKGETIALIRA